MFGSDDKGGKGSLGARLGNTKVVPKINASSAERALQEAAGVKSISIKGASSRGNVVEVQGLAPGTTAEDVRVCALHLCCLSFAHCVNTYSRLSFRSAVSRPKASLCRRLRTLL